MAQNTLNAAKDAFDKAVQHLKQEFGQLQTGRASSNLVDNIMIEVYGAMQPIKNVASVSVPDGKTVQIQPWDKTALPAIEKAIQNSDLNLNPVNNGNVVILNIPPLTEERRRDLVKVVGRLAEEAKISIRNARHDAMTTFKRMEHEGDLTEDDRKHFEKKLQDSVDAMNAEIGELSKKKEESIMKV